MTATRPPIETLPHNLEAERAVLGAMMLEFEALEFGARHLTANEFYREPHRLIFSAMNEIYQSGKHYDPLVTEEMLRRDSVLDAAGGTNYLISLYEQGLGFTAQSIEYYAALVREAAIRRDIIALARESDGLARGEGLPVADAVADLKERWQSLAANKFEETLKPLKEILHSAYQDLEVRQEMEGARVGLRKLDNALGGLFPGSLYVLAARPRQGKTTMCLNWLAHLAVKEETPCAFFSMEMKDISLAHKIIAAESGVDAFTLRIAKPQDEHWGMILQACNRLGNPPLWIDDSAGLTLNQLLTRIRAAVRRWKIKVVGIDYLQLLHVPGLEIRQAMVASTHGIKALARELDISIILLSQISRAAEARYEQRPTLSDLKESGSIEEDADVVLFIYHPKGGNPQEGVQADLIIAKNRLGPGGGEIKLHWKPSQQKFFEVENERTYYGQD